VLEKEKYTKKNLINMYKLYPTQHMANWWKIETIMQTQMLQRKQS
jgi:hypothetical protein